MEKRKQQEIDFHNKIRDIALREDQEAYNYYWSNKKFYSITRKSTKFYNDWLVQKGQDKKVLDYCCGDGDISISLAKQGFEVVGIDISGVSIENCRRAAIQENVSDKTTFDVMDAENMEFDDDSFDLIVCSGVLHHLDLTKAFPELARVLKPNGEIICIEPLAYNPLIQLYRKRTPHLRTEWEAEHILTLADLDLARKYFGQVEVKFFHLATLAAVPFRNIPWFDALLGWLETVDEIILSFSVIQTQAWQMIFTLSQPNQPSTQGSFVMAKRQVEKKLLVGTLALAGLIGAVLTWRSYWQKYSL